MKNNISVVLTSNNKSYVFDLSKDRKLTYFIYKSSVLIESKTLEKEKIIMYSATIDSNDTLYLVVLNDSGDLICYKYVEEIWSPQKITKFDLHSNLYNQLEISAIQNDIHILYNYSNLINSNVWTIQHIIYNDGIKKMYNAIRYLSKRYPEPFVFDIDSIGNIHLIYQSNIQNLQIHYGFYSPFSSKWSYKNQKISEDNVSSISPNIFIDSNDTIHLTWIEKKDDNLSLNYHKMESRGKQNYIWRKMNLPKISSLDLDSNPILFEEKGNLKYIYTFNNNLYLLLSKDYGETWIKENVKTTLNKDSKLSKIICNSDYSKYKIIYGYINLHPKLDVLYLNIDYKLRVNRTVTSVIDENHKEESIIIEQKNTPKELKDDTKIDKDILNYINSIDSNIKNIISYHPYVKSYLEDILEHQKILENKINKLENHLNQENKTFIERIFGFSK